MIQVGYQCQRTCQGTTRRTFLQAGLVGLLGLSWPDYLRLRALAEEPTLPVRARSVILLWLWGGPSHLDTWDMKPSAPLEYRGPFSPIATAVPGVRICELFPQTARLARDFALIRSLRTQSNDHGVAGTIGLTGSASGAVDLGGKVRNGTPLPTLGAVVARARTGVTELPPFTVIGGKLHQGKKMIVGEGGGHLGAQYDPFRVEYDLDRGLKIPALELQAELSPDRLEDRRLLLQTFDALKQELETAQRARALDQYRLRALAMLTSAQAVSAFDLSQERDAVRDRYGRTRFGQSCLLARRLVEAGVPFVQVNWSSHVEAEEDSGDGGWDHHYRNFQIMQDRHGPWLDQSLSALLEDLKQRGMLDSTLVLAVGEFGRTPKINDKAGRDHWEHCYSALVAGGGIRGGVVYGESDKRGEHPRTDPCTPADLAATVQHLVGISSEMAQALRLPVEGTVLHGLL